MFGYDHDMSGWSYAGLFIGVTLFGILVVVAIIALIRFRAGPGRNAPRRASCAADYSPQEFLAARFARGEIGVDDYRRCVRLLGEHL